MSEAMTQTIESGTTAPACSEADCAFCSALACRTCEAQGVEPGSRPCFEHRWDARHQAAPPAGSTAAPHGPTPAPQGPPPRCPGCGVPLAWDRWDAAFRCESGKHPGEGRGARAYVMGERGRLRAASPEADPTSEARKSKAEATEGVL